MLYDTITRKAKKAAKDFILASVELRTYLREVLSDSRELKKITRQINRNILIAQHFAECDQDDCEYCGDPT